MALEQAAPFGRHSHFPEVELQNFVQHWRSSEHAAPMATHPHLLPGPPGEHLPLQQSASARQPSEPPLHEGAAHLPLVQTLPEQQSGSTLQGPSSGWHAHRPPLQDPEQQSESLMQVPVSVTHLHVPARHAPVQHWASVAHEPDGRQATHLAR